jgi:hypothetical protein
MSEWCRRLGKPSDRYQKLAETIQRAMWWIIGPHLAPGGSGWGAMGYHIAALALRAKALDDNFHLDAVEFIKQHWRDCFPNNPNAPRLSDPSVASTQLITPYFAHYAFPQLIEREQMDFVLDQYRSCWGWMLKTGATTCLEVFDPRWSHCHQWSACPTWQLSRYVLGLRSRFDRADCEFDLHIEPGSLERASGKIPFAGAVIEIQWRRTDGKIQYELSTPRVIRLRMPDNAVREIKSHDRFVL